MKRIKTSELKTHLSRYLRELRETGEGIEVCAREEAVAYLTPAKSCREDGAAAIAHELEVLGSRLQAAGLTLDVPSWRRNWLAGGGFRLDGPPPAAGDGRSDVSSVQEIRQERDW